MALHTCPRVLLQARYVTFSFAYCKNTLDCYCNQGRVIQTVTTTLTSTNLLALLIIFLFSFTKVVHRSSEFTAHLAIVLTLLFLAFVMLPFMTSYCLICYKMFPPNYESVLFYKEDFGKRGEALYFFYWVHSYKLKETIHPRWRKLSKFFSTKFGGHWTRMKAFVWKLSPRTSPKATNTSPPSA